VKADPLTTKPVDTLHPNTRNLALVNADEIARLLDEGQAASIDAAAAIASGVTTLPDSSVQNDLEPVSEQAAYPAKP
jgi:hypothetical protein